MKAMILAGGFGTRLSEETTIRPKPMVEVGGVPIIWHIMRIYAAFGIEEFIVCCGYKGEIIKEYFVNYTRWRSDLTVDLGDGSVRSHTRGDVAWKVTLVDTGLDTMTGGRMLRARRHLDDATFCLTYGDGVADIDIDALLRFHRESDALVTLTAVQPPGRFGALTLGEGQTKVSSFAEKPDSGDGGRNAWINGGFFVVEPEALDYIEGDETIWERGPLSRLAEDGQLAAYRHTGFWQSMDTLRDRNVLENEWATGTAAWTKAWV